MDCGCRHERIKYRCGHYKEHPTLTVRCGAARDTRNRKLCFPGTQATTTFARDLCERPECPQQRFRGGKWQCCSCGDNDQSRMWCSTTTCGNICCIHCTQGILPRSTHGRSQLLSEQLTNSGQTKQDLQSMKQSRMLTLQKDRPNSNE